jgi:hypothetical protein
LWGVEFNAFTELFRGEWVKADSHETMVKCLLNTAEGIYEEHYTAGVVRRTFKDITKGELGTGGECLGFVKDEETRIVFEFR